MLFKIKMFFRRIQYKIEDMQNRWAFITGIVLLLIGFLFLIASLGHAGILDVVLIAAGAILGIGGFLLLSFIGAFIGLVPVVLLRNLMEKYPMPTAIILLIAGAAFLLYSIISTRKYENSYYYDSYPSTSSKNRETKKDWDYYSSKSPVDTLVYFLGDLPSYLKEGTPVSLEPEDQFEEASDYVLKADGFILRTISDFAAEQLKDKAIYVTDIRYNDEGPW